MFYFTCVHVEDRQKDSSEGVMVSSFTVGDKEELSPTVKDWR